MTTQTQVKHSPEPWGMVRKEPSGKTWEFKRPHWRIGSTVSRHGVGIIFSEPDVDSDANARRVIACVNALSGIPTEAIEQGVVGKLRDFVQAYFAYMEEGVSPAAGAMNAPPVLEALRQMAHRVLAKIEGREP